MKRILLISAIVLSGAAAFVAPRLRHAQADPPALPACAADGDKDGDGVADADDSDEADSCRASSTGFEDCSTGAGDGLPDCQ